MDFFTLVGLNACFYFLIYAIILWFTDCDIQLNFADKFGKKLVKLKGKVLWITGASSELGKVMALLAAKHRGKLALSSDSPKELKKLKALCLQMNSFMRNTDILILDFDTSESKNHKYVLAKIIRHFGTLDILILNEDKWGKSDWEETSSTMDRLLFQSNVFGVVNLTRSVLRYFNSKHKGQLAVTSSIAGLIGVPYSGCYTGTKHALHGYFNSLRVEKLGENIQVTLLCLGSQEFPQKNMANNDKFSDLKTRKRKKITPERCAHLCLTAIINNLDEVWMAAFPILVLVYGLKYFPNFTKFLLKCFRLKGERNLRTKCTFHPSLQNYMQQLQAVVILKVLSSLLLSK